mmetsp:Transcript_1125/g.2570  ORF Transcript_1125/g.2570 Transcript_1125/m.2570 type:complete len:164 (-) Transcript_1125:417-908(-)
MYTTAHSPQHTYQCVAHFEGAGRRGSPRTSPLLPPRTSLLRRFAAPPKGGRWQRQDVPLSVGRDWPGRGLDARDMGRDTATSRPLLATHSPHPPRLVRSRARSRRRRERSESRWALRPLTSAAALALMLGGAAQRAVVGAVLTELLLIERVHSMPIRGGGDSR